MPRCIVGKPRRHYGTGDTNTGPCPNSRVPQKVLHTVLLFPRWQKRQTPRLVLSPHDQRTSGQTPPSRLCRPVKVLVPPDDNRLKPPDPAASPPGWSLFLTVSDAAELHSLNLCSWSVMICILGPNSFSAKPKRLH
ncbi:hypothetical protein AGIG_G4633 [Arapaima gigas]